MIVGIGVDLVDIARFERTIERTPRLLERLFAPAERERAPRSLAARYAAKEALIKALGGSDGVHWTEIEITPEPSGRPWFTLSGSTAAVVAERGITGIHLSMSHDGGFATAYVVAEASGQPSRNHIPAETPRGAVGLDPNVVSRRGGDEPGPGADTPTDAAPPGAGTATDAATPGAGTATDAATPGADEATDAATGGTP